MAPFEPDRWQPVPVPPGDGRHDIGDDVRAAIVERLTSDWSRDPDLTPEKLRQLAMWAAASVRALFHDIGTLREMEKSEGNAAKSEGHSSVPIPPRLHTAIQCVIRETRGFNQRKQEMWCLVCRYKDPLDQKLHDPECPIYELHGAWEEALAHPSERP